MAVKRPFILTDPGMKRLQKLACFMKTHRGDLCFAKMVTDSPCTRLRAIIQDGQGGVIWPV